MELDNLEDITVKNWWKDRASALPRMWAVCWYLPLKTCWGNFYNEESENDLPGQATPGRKKIMLMKAKGQQIVLLTETVRLDLHS